LLRIEAGNDIPQTTPLGQLSKTQAQELLPAGKSSHSFISSIFLDTFLKLKSRNEFNNLRENIFTFVHEKIGLKKHPILTDFSEIEK
jgi:hypothetical protein